MQKRRQTRERDVSLYVSFRRGKHKHGPAWSSLQSGAQVRMNDGYVTSTPTAGQSIEFQGVIDCHENLPRSLSSVLACTRRGHMCLA